MCFKWQKAGQRARKTDGCCSVGGIKFSNGDRGSANETQHQQQEHQDGRMSRLRSMIRFTVSRWWKALPTEAIVGLQGRPMSNSRRSMAHMIMKDRMPGIRFLSQSKIFFLYKSCTSCYFILQILGKPVEIKYYGHFTTAGH